MTSARLGLGGASLRPWLGSVGLGAGVGAVVVTGHQTGVWSVASDLGGRVTSALDASVGPVWLPMLLVAGRVAWLAGRALRTRLGGGVAEPVRPELAHLAPLFAALGLCGTVWGLMQAFDALGEGEFLTRLPALLGGLGTAMISTLVGLSLQILTLLLAAVNPTWSTARIAWEGEQSSFALDERSLGEGEAGLEGLLAALEARRPEALRLRLDARLPASERARVRAALWQRTDSTIPFREVTR